MTDVERYKILLARRIMHMDKIIANGIIYFVCFANYALLVDYSGLIMVSETRFYMIWIVKVSV